MEVLDVLSRIDKCICAVLHRNPCPSPSTLWNWIYTRLSERKRGSSRERCRVCVPRGAVPLWSLKRRLWRRGALDGTHQASRPRVRSYSVLIVSCACVASDGAAAPAVTLGPESEVGERPADVFAPSMRIFVRCRLGFE